MKNAIGLSLMLLASLGATGCATEGDEAPVAMSELPAPVRATLQRESAGGSVTEIEKETKDGRTVYSADMVVSGVAWDIVVAEDGTVVSKERE